mgnify:CR=1 FL=1
MKSRTHIFTLPTHPILTNFNTPPTGYYRDGRYERTFYTIPRVMYQLQKKRPLVGPFWAREFERAHHEIDDIMDT